MARPHCPRRVDGNPRCGHFKPAGIPLRSVEEVQLTLDEFEAMRLCDLEGHYLEEAAKRMEVSRPTLSRILDSARRKVADVLVNGKSLRIEGGVIMPQGKREFECRDCGHKWERPFGGGRPQKCPECESANIHRCDCLRADGSGHGHGHRHGAVEGQGRGTCRRSRVRE